MNYTNELLNAYELHAVTGWFGEMVMTFKVGEDCETYRRMYRALCLVSGLDVTNPDTDTPNEYGIISISATPKTAEAAALCSLIFQSFHIVR